MSKSASAVSKDWEGRHNLIPPPAPPTTETAPESPGRSRITFILSDEAADRLRDAVYWTPGANLSGFVEEAITEKIARLERDKPFPKRPKELRAGRPGKLAR
jgi:hypothetical protein